MIDFNEKALKEKNILCFLILNPKYKENILWACDEYDGYSFIDHISENDILDEVDIRPRILKTKEVQKGRTKEKAEVFTPSYICNYQNKETFNLAYTKGMNWKKKICLMVIEITCGEAPYLVSRYDTTTGEEIPLNKRIGQLDIKMRLVNSKSKDEEWFKWAKKSFQSTYGFEWQGDSLLLARENLLGTFIDYYKDRFNEDPPEEYLKEICDIISWNIFQMDGLTYNIPMTDKPAYIKDWGTGEVIKFRDLIEETEPSLF